MPVAQETEESDIDTTGIFSVESGHSELARVDIPGPIKREWGLSYGTYIRVSMGREQNHPVVAFSPKPEDESQRASDLKMTSTSQMPLPLALVRSFGMRGEMDWSGFGTRLVGSPSRYNDGTTLLHVAQYYSDSDFHESIYTDPEDPDEPPFTSFSDLQMAARQTEFNSSDVFGTKMERSRVVHKVPGSFSVEEGDEYLFVLFDDGYTLLVGLLPVKPEEADTSEHSKKVRLINAWLAAPEADPEEIEDITDASYSYAVRIQKRLERNEFQEAELEELRDETLLESYKRRYSRHSGGQSDTSSNPMSYNPMSASPDVGLADEYDEVKAPTEVLDYDKDRVRIRKDSDGDYVYTLPKQVAHTLWMDEGYDSDWLQVGDVLFASLTPSNQSAIQQRLTP